MSLYAIAHIIHLYCAIAFVGGIFFEMLVLSVMHTGRVSRESRREVERAMSYRAVRRREQCAEQNSKVRTSWQQDFLLGGFPACCSARGGSHLLWGEQRLWTPAQRDNEEVSCT